jgi:hypothetical protein
MKKYELFVVEARVYVDSERSDTPLVNKCMEKVAEGNTFKKLVENIQIWMNRMKLESVEFDPESASLRVEKEGVVFECEFASDEGAPISPKNAEIVDTNLF